MELIDTHCHIYYDSYKKDIDDVIKKANKNNVTKMICVGVDIETSKKSLNLANKYSSVYATCGFHPHESKDAKNNYLTQLEEFTKSKKIVAIGETGLDYFYNHSDKKTQKKIFIEQMELSKSLDYPLIIHCREAEIDIIECIKLTNTNKGVVHCFSGSRIFADKLFDLGFIISFTGMITFKNNLLKILKDIPLNKFMLETDSPYLTPIPFRGKRNEPSMIKVIAENIAKIKDVSVSEIAKETTKNAEELFGL